jgi:hypothetical protein
MALIKCLECGREISSAALACPGCGRPVPRKKYVGWKPVVVVGAVVIALVASLYRGRLTPIVAHSPLEMRVQAPSPVCRDEGLYNKVIDLIAKRDRDGAERVLDSAIADNQCQILLAGQQVTIEKGTDLPCVGWHGEAECWYISPMLIEMIP